MVHKSCRNPRRCYCACPGCNEARERLTGKFLALTSVGTCDLSHDEAELAAITTPHQTFLDGLTEWKDWDVAQYWLGSAIGLWAETDPLQLKHVFWSSHPIGELLFSFLERLADEGVLLRRDEPDTGYRRNPDYRGSWAQ